MKAMKLVRLDVTGNTLTFNTALVGSSKDLDVTVVSPALIPRVGDEPVLLTVLDTITNGFDGVTTEHLTSLVRVDTGLVGQEVFVDGEGDFDRSLSRDLGHHVLLTSHTVSTLALFEVAGIGSARALGALFLAGRGWQRSTTSWVLRRSDMVSARSHRVRLAVNSVGIEASGNETSGLEVRPGSARVTTIAAHTARVAAIK